MCGVKYTPAQNHLESPCTESSLALRPGWMCDGLSPRLCFHALMETGSIGGLRGSGGIQGGSPLHWSHAFLAQTGSMSHPLEQTAGEVPASGTALAWLPPQSWVRWDGFCFASTAACWGNIPGGDFFPLELCRADTTDGHLGAGLMSLQVTAQHIAPMGCSFPRLLQFCSPL